MSISHEKATEIVNRCISEIKNERIRQGYSQRKLSSLAGVDHTTLHLIESGKRNPTLATLILLYDVLREDNPSFDALKHTRVLDEIL
ncbi:MAG: helix-turn-helix transcriptional regulator [Kiritimatiellia bacterium]